MSAISRLIAFSCLVLPFTQSEPGPSGSLAYRHAGEIWVRHLPDGAPLQISRGGGESPQWSASGRWLSFRQDRKFIVAPIDDNRREAITLEAPGVWSPIKDELVFADAGGLTMLSFEGTSERKRVVAGNIGDIAWSPDGTRLAFLKNGRLWRVNVDGSDPKELFAPNAKDGILIRAWSSDGKYIIVAIDPDHSASIAAGGLTLAFVPVEGGRAHTFNSNVLLHSDFLSVSSDHPEIIVSTGGGRESWTQKRVARVDPATGRFSLLTAASNAAVSPAWSSDGNRIAYVSADDAQNAGGGEEARKALSKRRIWIMNADGSQKRRLTSDLRYRDEYPHWSRDGQYILFVRVNDQDKASIWAINVERGMLRELLDDLDDENPINDIIKPKRASAWFGYYGTIDWARTIAWHPE